MMNLKMLLCLSLILLSCGQPETADFIEMMPTVKSENTLNLAENNVFGKGGFATDIDKVLNQTQGVKNSSTLDLGNKLNQMTNTNDQKIIKNASLRFEVKNYMETRNRINPIIKCCNAYISSERETKTDYQIFNNIQIRVPADKFETLIDSLVKLSKNLDEKNIMVEDITEEFVDVSARLNAKRKIEERYIEILKSTKTVKEVLEVENMLGEIREEIESKEGRLKYLSKQIAFSTIDLSFYEQKLMSPQSRIGFLRKLSISFTNGWNGLTNLLFEIVAIWPLLLILAIISIIITNMILIKRKATTKKKN